MFIYTNPPRKSKKCKKVCAKPAKKRQRRKHKKFSVFTEGGGKILAANNNPMNNPSKSVSWSSIFNRHLRSRRGVAQARSHTMARRRRHNSGNIFAPPSQSRQKGLLDYKGFFKNMVGVTPIIGGVIANGLASAFLSSKIPYTKQGIGNVALGIVSASGLGYLTSMVSKNKNLGNGVLVGGIVGTLGCWFQKAMSEGLVASLKPGMHGWADSNMSGWANEGFNGMGDFTTPSLIQNAIQPQSNISQYSLPMTTGQFVPTVAPPPTPAHAAQAGTMADYEQGAIGAVLGNETNFGM
jgi:hypothetical protein